MFPFFFNLKLKYPDTREKERKKKRKMNRYKVPRESNVVSMVLQWCAQPSTLPIGHIAIMKEESTTLIKALKCGKHYIVVIP